MAMGIFHTTDSVNGNERFSYWCEFLCDTHLNLDVEHKVPDDSFFGSIETNRLGEIQLSHLISKSQIVNRSKVQISRYPEDNSLLCYQVSGKIRITQDGRTTILNPFEFVLCDGTRPFEFSIPGDHELLILKVPNKELTSRLAFPEIMTANAIPAAKGLGRVTFDFINSLRRELGKANTKLPEKIGDIIVELFTSCMNERFRSLNYSSRKDIVKLIELKSFIHAHLRNPQLSVDMIATDLNVSTRYVHMLFRNEKNTVSEFIRNLRLENCKKDLENPNLLNRSITDISFFWGFNDSSHFSKLFKKRFGVSARDCRRLIKSYG